MDGLEFRHPAQWTHRQCPGAKELVDTAVAQKMLCVKVITTLERTHSKSGAEQRYQICCTFKVLSLFCVKVILASLPLLTIQTLNVRRATR